MYKITKTYTDFDGVERTEDFYFNLSKAELTEMQATTDGGFDNYIQRIVDAKNTKEIVETFKYLVFKAYGEKSPDGRRFIKSEKLTEEFSQTNAYSDIFMELATDDKAAEAFVNGILPNDLVSEMNSRQRIAPAN